VLIAAPWTGFGESTRKPQFPACQAASALPKSPEEVHVAVSKFHHKDCAITVSAHFLSGPKRWQPFLLIARLRENAARIREQAIANQPAVFSSAQDALEFGVVQARRLIDGDLPGLRI